MPKIPSRKTRANEAIFCYQHLIRKKRIAPGGAAYRRFNVLRKQMINWNDQYPSRYKER